tara:strand:+ start:3530 stop:3994 length:465 start_codon:yes stop_codon:yes gene_type:complete
MKQLFLVASLMLSVSTYAQWEVGEYVDESGLTTGYIYLHQTAMGVFSKGKKKNKSCSFFLEHDMVDKTFIITIYPYGRLTEEQWNQDTFQWAIIKQPSGELRSVEAFCFDGMIYFEGKEYDEFLNVISNDGLYILTMSHIEDSVKTYYKFSFYN